MMSNRTDSAPGGESISSIDSTTMAPLCAIFRRHLKEQNLKYTPERADILDAIIEQDGIFEADTLMHEMRSHGARVSKATVYRTLKLLQEAGIINQTLFDGKQAHYQLVYGRTDLDSMICVNTGAMIQIDCPELSALRDELCRKHGWEPVGHRFQVYGVSPGSAPTSE
ncbi:MAG: transcriptional repressor [Phycisphaerales bacterium]|nr:transcriptional repressor [Phycisphaerales bacterium]